MGPWESEPSQAGSKYFLCFAYHTVEPWQEAYRELETALVTILASEAEQLDTWLATSEPAIDHSVAV